VSSVDQIVSFVQGITIAVAVIYVIVAVGFLVLGLLNLRGANAARIVTWVIAGLGVLCFGCLASLSAAGGGMSSRSGNVEGVDTQRATEEINNSVPAWSRPTSLAVLVIIVLAMILVIILLALPSSNAYFRREPVAEPPVPGMPYPSYGPAPEYPPAPGSPPPAPPPPPGSTPPQ
jgi:hypothetical protein